MARSLLVAGIFEQVKPINFVTIASPHLGTLRRPSSVLPRIYNKLQQLALVRVGKQLSLTDHYLDGTPLLLVMSDPSQCFHQALARFSKLALFANIRNDFTVRYTTSAIATSNPFRRCLEVQPHPHKYPSIVEFSPDQQRKDAPWTWSQIGYLALLAIFSPVLVPLASLVLMCRLTWESIKARSRVSELVFDSDWITTSPPITAVVVDPSSTAGSASASSAKTIAQQDVFTQRHWMIASLNSLSWNKFSVSIYGANAHAAIVQRRKAKQGKDVLEFFAKNVFVT